MAFKLTWNAYIDHLLTKTKKNLNITKTISRLPWGMDSKTLIHISTAIVRSRLTYGQEVYFNAPKYLLDKLQSLDCKAIKISLGVPVHASNKEVYKTSGILPLNEYRTLAASKFVIKSCARENFIQNEINIRSDIDFPKRALNISSQKTIATYTQELIKTADIRKEQILKIPSHTPIPQWELTTPSVDISYSDITKDENINILSSIAKIHISERYKSHLHIFTDGSLLDNNCAGAAFVIPALKIERSFFLGKKFSIFTAELTAIMSALEYIMELRHTFPKIVIFIDLKSVLQVINSFNTKNRPDLVYRIYDLVHQISTRDSEIEFCWVPSHSSIRGNDMADRAAKKGAMNNGNTTSLHILLSVDEVSQCLEKVVLDSIYSVPADRHKINHFYQFLHKRFYGIALFSVRRISSLILRLKLDCLRTKFSKTTCSCGENISRDHILFHCPVMKQFLPKLPINAKLNLQDTLEDMVTLVNIAEACSQSPIGHLL